MDALLASDLLRGPAPATIQDGDRTAMDSPRPGTRIPATRIWHAPAWSGVALVLGALLLAGCARGDALEQTWPQSYGSTTCREWTGEMTARQRWVASTEILMYAQRGDGASSLPADAQVKRFRREISTTCADEKSGRLPDVALGVYIIGRSRFGA